MNEAIQGKSLFDAICAVRSMQDSIRAIQIFRSRRVNSHRDTLLRHAKTHGIDHSQLEAGITLSQMNHDSRISSEDNNHGTERLAIGQSQMNLDPRLESLQDWQSGIPEPMNNSTMRNGYESQASSFPTVQPSVNTDDNLRDLSTGMSIQADGQTHYLGGTFPGLMEDATGVSPLSANNLWGASLMSPGPSWLVGYDFDLEALNTSVSATMGITEPLFQSQISRSAVPTLPQSQVPPKQDAPTDQNVANDSVRRGWFSHIDQLDDEDDHGRTASGQMTPVTASNRYDIGDSFRHKISQRLRARTNDEPLPSTNFLVCPILCETTQMGGRIDIECRIYLSKYISPSLILYFPSSTARHFDLHRRTRCFCCQSRL